MPDANEKRSKSDRIISTCVTAFLIISGLLTIFYNDYSDYLLWGVFATLIIVIALANKSILDALGISYIVSLCKKTKDGTKPPSFTIWIIATYAAIFTISLAVSSHTQSTNKQLKESLQATLNDKINENTMPNVKELLKNLEKQGPNFLRPIQTLRNLFIQPHLPTNELSDYLTQVFNVYQNIIPKRVGLNLTGMNLRNINIVSQTDPLKFDLVDLSGADLTGAKFENCDLYNVVLSMETNFKDMVINNATRFSPAFHKNDKLKTIEKPRNPADPWFNDLGVDQKQAFVDNLCEAKSIKFSQVQGTYDSKQEYAKQSQFTLQSMLCSNVKCKGKVNNCP